jgi:predicted phage gp36 major capsid-like protein
MGTLAGTQKVITIFGEFQRGYLILDGKTFGIQRLSELYLEAGLVVKREELAHLSPSPG